MHPVTSSLFANPFADTPLPTSTPKSNSSDHHYITTATRGNQNSRQHREEDVMYNIPMEPVTITDTFNNTSSTLKKEHHHSFYSPSSSYSQPPKQSQDNFESSPPRYGQLKAEVSHVIDIMHDNTRKILERGEKLEDVQAKAEQLNASAVQFSRGSSALRKKLWWQDVKTKMLGAFLILVVLAAVVGSIVAAVKSQQPAVSQAP